MCACISRAPYCYREESRTVKKTLRIRDSNESKPIKLNLFTTNMHVWLPQLTNGCVIIIIIASRLDKEQQRKKKKELPDCKTPFCTHLKLFDYVVYQRVNKIAILSPSDIHKHTHTHTKKGSVHVHCMLLNHFRYKPLRKKGEHQ